MKPGKGWHAGRTYDAREWWFYPAGDGVEANAMRNEDGWNFYVTESTPQENGLSKRAARGRAAGAIEAFKASLPRQDSPDVADDMAAEIAEWGAS